MASVYNHEGEKVGLAEKLWPWSDYRTALRESKADAKRHQEAKVGKSTFKKVVSGLFSSAGIFARMSVGVALLLGAIALAKDGFKQFLTPAWGVFTGELKGFGQKVKEKIPGAETAVAVGNKGVELGGKALDKVEFLTDAAGRVTDMAVDVGMNAYDKAKDLDHRAANTITPGKATLHSKADAYFQARAVRPETGECRAKQIQELNKQRGITSPPQGSPTGGAPQQTQPGSAPTTLPSIPGCDF